MESPLIDEDCARLLEALAAQGGVRFRDLPLKQARAATLLMSQQLDLPCESPCAVTDLCPRTPGVPLRLYSPGTASHPEDAQPVIVYAHGGGWIVGNLETCDALCRHLATRSGYRVLSVDYRLAPEHPFPAGLEDVLGAIRWVAGSAHECGASVGGVAIAGDSAGGALAAAASVARVAAGAAPLAALLLYPVTDLSRWHPSYEAFAEGYLLEAQDMRYFANLYAPTLQARDDPRASPLLTGDLTGMPPTTLLTCGLDVLRDEGRAFAKRLVDAGIETNYLEAHGQLHGIATLRGAIPSGRIWIDRAIDDFARRIAHRARTVSSSARQPPAA